MFGRRFGMDVENLIKQKSSNHIVLKSRSFSFDGKSKAPSHITRRTSFAQEKVKGVQLNKSIAESVILKDKQTCLPTSILEDPQLVPHFLKDCIKHMKTLQSSKKVVLETMKSTNPDYTKKRAEIVDWLVGLHYQLKLFPQTLFIAISYMDRTCASLFISSSQFYLLAASCLLIAGKFQETYQIPNIKSIQQCSQFPLDKERMIKMEQKILGCLEFCLIVQTPLKYLELLAKVSNLSQKNFCIAKYILQLSLLEGSFLEFSPSILGASVIYLVHKIRKIGPSWPTYFKQLVGYDDVNLKICAKALCSLLERSQEIQNGKNIRTKFSKTQFCCASSIRLQRKNQ